MYEGDPTRIDSSPLQGFLVEDSEDQLKVRVSQGTWIIERADVVDLSDWTDPVTEHNFQG